MKGNKYFFSILITLITRCLHRVNLYFYIDSAYVVKHFINRSYARYYE